MSAFTVLFVTESVPSVFTTICSGGLLSTIVERKLNFPEIGPTFAEIIPSKVLSSICVTSIDAGQAGGKFVDIDQKVPGLFRRNVEIDFSVQNHCVILLQKNFTARSYVTR